MYILFFMLVINHLVTIVDDVRQVIPTNINNEAISINYETRV
jgi:hypothetical protein